MGERIRRMKGNIHETENYSWGVIQDMIEKEINAAFKIREPPIQMTLPSKKELSKIIRDTVRKRREENSKDSKR